MTKKTLTNLLLVLLGLAAFELSILFAVTDLNIWLAIGNINSPFGLFMEVLGKLAAPIMLIICGLVISIYTQTQPDDPRRYLKFYAGCACTTGGQTYCLFVYLKLDRTATVVCCIINILLLGLVVWLLISVDKGRLFQLYCVALTTVSYGIAVLVIISLLKMCWGRVRPRDLKSLADFTRFYLPQGFTGNTSFPSGHVSNACIVYAITMLAPILKKLWAKILIYALPIAWIFLMAVNRIVIGAHFASDTLYGIIISISLFYLIKPIVIRCIAKYL